MTTAAEAIDLTEEEYVPTPTDIIPDWVIPEKKAQFWKVTTFQENAMNRGSHISAYYCLKAFKGNLRMFLLQTYPCYFDDIKRQFKTDIIVHIHKVTEAYFEQAMIYWFKPKYGAKIVGNYRKKRYHKDLQVEDDDYITEEEPWDDTNRLRSNTTYDEKL